MSLQPVLLAHGGTTFAHDAGSPYADKLVGKGTDSARESKQKIRHNERAAPPSTGTMIPLRYEAAGDITNAATLPNSAGSP